MDKDSLHLIAAGCKSAWIHCILCRLSNMQGYDFDCAYSNHSGGNKVIKLALKIIPLALVVGLLSSPDLFAETEGSRAALINTAVIDAENGAGPWGNELGIGCGNDIVKAAFASVNYPIELNIVPYAQCKSDVMQGHVVGCYGMARGDTYVDATTTFGNPPLYYNSSVILMRGAAGKNNKNLNNIPQNSTMGIVIGYEYATAIMDIAKKRGVRFQTSDNEKS